MICVDQTKYTEKDGNCFAACLASILEVPLSEIPNPKEKTIWLDKINKWLILKFRLMLVLVDFRVGNQAPVGYTIGSGKSPRMDCLHAVVCKDGAIVHDPHPDRSGLRDDVIEDHALFVLTDPKKWTIK